MSNVFLVLGPVLFADFEIPERISFGGDQRLAVHDLPGGERVIDALGQRPTDITWSGIFSGPDATARARTLDDLLTQAAILTLSWDVFFYSVVIRNFTAEYRNTAWVPYTVRCTVLRDEAQATLGAAASLLADVLGDTISAAAFSGLAGFGLDALQTSLGANNATVPGTAAYLAAGSTLVTVQSGIQNGLLQAGTALNRPLNNAADVGFMIGNCGQAAQCASGAAYLGRAAVNLFDLGS